MLSRDELAARLSGREYGNEITEAEEREARDARLIVFFGYSDDGVEIRGIIDDEVGAYGGATLKIAHDDGAWEILRDDGTCERCTRRLGGLPYISVIADWCPDGFGGAWRISSPVPHAAFNIVEDGELFCRGIVMAEADMQAFLAEQPEGEMGRSVILD